MKKVFSTITMIMLAMMSVTLTSCEDEAIAYDLAGANGKVWSGTISAFYTRYGWSGDHYRTTIEFYCDENHWRKGWGYEVDYDLNTNKGYKSKFRWEVRNKNIILTYYDNGQSVYIRDYELHENYFGGYIEDGTGRDIWFSLNLIHNFDWDYDGYNYYGPNYAKRNTTDTQTLKEIPGLQRVIVTEYGVINLEPQTEAETK